MDEETIKINPNNVNCFVLTTLSCIYIISRSMTSTPPLINMIKGKFRSLAGLFLKLSIISAVCYNAALFFISFKFDIDKVTLELSHSFNEKYNVNIQNYTFDVVYLLITSLRISETLFISCLFITISCICNTSNNHEGTNTDVLRAIRSKICNICRIWGIFRIPLTFYSYYAEPLIDTKLYLFLRLMVGSIEFAFVCAFIFFSRFRNASAKNMNVDPGFLVFCCFSYGFLKYTINLIDFPFKLTKTHMEIVISSQFGFLCSIYLLLAEVLFPRKNLKILPKDPEPIRELTNEVAMLESVIVFDDKNSLIKKN